MLLINFVVVKFATFLRHNGKQNCEKWRNKSSKLDLVFTDVLGPMPTTSLDGNRYAISFTDSYSRYSVVYFLKSKDECLDKIKNACAQMGVPRAIHSHIWKEYISKSLRVFVYFCISIRIKRDHILRPIFRLSKLVSVKVAGEQQAKCLAAC